MNRTKVAVAAIVFLAVAGAAVAQEPAPAGGGEGTEIKVTAKKYQFDPNVITVKKGDHVKLVITALDRTKEPGSAGEPLYLDVVAALNEASSFKFDTPLPVERIKAARESTRSLPLLFCSP